MRVGWERCVSRGNARWTRLNSGGIPAGRAQKRRHGVGGVESPEEAGMQQEGQL